MTRLKQLSLYIVIALLCIYPAVKTVQSAKMPLPVFAFLIPQKSTNFVSTHVWLQAAKEEGVPMEPLFYEQLLNSFQKNKTSPKVILLPDEVARYAPAVLISVLQRYVNEGGKLVLVSDALTQDYNERLSESFPLETYFNFPKVIGRVGDTITYKHDSIKTSEEWMKELKIPPGLVLPTEDGLRQFSNYQSKQPPYPHWQTLPASQFKGKTLLQAADGSFVAGIQQMGKGETLWINLPLSYLKKRTDGLFLHSFLRWISEDWAGLPRILSVPNGVGGMVLNIHVDSNASLPGLEVMNKLKLFSQGPFSIHVTAGPDAHLPGDQLGFNLPENENSQKWVKKWVSEGHEVGAHGGWVHDYFGVNVADQSTPEFENLLAMNLEWVGKISGKPVREYSSPIGHHPVWLSQWISEHGYGSYYFTGNNGLGPTRSFRDDQFTDQALWSFPVASFQQVASFEEAEQQNIPQQDFQNWLFSLTNYVVENQTSRLFYFHPTGVRFFQTPLSEWMNLNQQLSIAGRFQWYTMDQLAVFLDQREKISWNLSSEDTGKMRLFVHGAEGLSKMVWRFSKKSTSALAVQRGQGVIRENKNFYEFQPASDNEVELTYEGVTP